MQNSLLKFLSIVALLACFQTGAREPVYFLPDKNNLQVLPLKFEYSLLNNSTIRIGDIVIDSNNLSMQFNSEGPSRSFTITWPAGLFKEAELVLFSNYGKAIKKYTITNPDIELTTEKQELTDSLIRKQKAIYKTPLLEESLIEEIKYLPFFKFCLQRLEASTQIDLCSVELYFSTKDGKPAIKERAGNKKKAQVLINNAEVGEQGIIFLNDLTENINFKAQSESGAKLEIETRLKPVDFKDVIISEDGKKLLLTGQGPFPVSDKDVKKLGAELWQISLPKEFPVFYIQGEAGIPFRQEFYARGVLPTESLRTFSSDQKSETYSSSEELTLENPKGTSLVSKNANSKLAFDKAKSKMQWSVTGLEKGKETKRIIYLKKDQKEFAIYKSFFRVPAFQTQVSSTYTTAEKIFFLNLEIDYWLNNQKSGLSFSFDQALTKTSTVDKWTNMELAYLHRLAPGINFKASSYYLFGAFRLVTIGSSSFTHPGLGIGNKSQVTWKTLKSYADWFDWSFKYYLGSKSEQVEVKSIVTLSGLFYNELNKNYFLNYGLDFQNYSSSGLGSFKSTQVDLKAGLTYLF